MLHPIPNTWRRRHSMEYALIICLTLTSSLGWLEAHRPISCPKSCLEGDSLVCGSDGNIYSSECDLLMKTCGKPVSVVPREECLAGRQIMCERSCPTSFEPVCGTDGSTYNNTCFLEVETCRKGVKLAHFGQCNDLDEDETCPVECDPPTPEDGPVCGSNGNIYKSDCEMRLQTCGERVVRASHKFCKLTKDCVQDCSRIASSSARPVCGSDGNIYDNDCTMKQKNCGKHIYEIPMANCFEGSTCPKDCRGINSTVICGSDGNIYSSECEMKMLTCGQSRRVESVNLTECQAKLDQCHRRICSASYDPVCGTDGVTYSNICRLGLAKCLRGIRVAHLGLCHDHVIREVCPETCPPPSSAGESEPVCGSDGNVYSSACEMKRLTCGQKVMPLHLKHCHMTAMCYTVCPNVSRPVCGSDGNLYKSRCHLYAKNCGKHIYTVPLHYCLRRVFKGCFDICPMTFEPVCGTDKMTYSNVCFLRIEMCRSKGKVRLDHKGRCGTPPSQELDSDRDYD